MKIRILFILIILLLSASAYSQVSPEWNVRYNSSANNSDIPNSVAVDKSGNVFVTGTSTNTSSGEDVVTIKYNQTGTQNWIQRFTSNGNNSDRAVKILIDKDENIIIGCNGFTSEGSQDIVVIKYNQNGDSLWVARFNGASNKNDVMTEMISDNDGNILICGYTNTDEDASNYVTIKLSSSGQVIWSRTYNGRASNNDQATSVSFDQLGNVYVTGFSMGAYNNYDYTTIKYTSSGDSSWTRYYSGPSNGNDYANDVVVTAAGDIYVTGTSFGNNNNYDLATIKYTISGVQQWAVRYNGTDNKNDMGYKIMADLFDNIIIAGTSDGNGTGEDCLILKYNSMGVELWSSVYNGLGNSADHPTELVVDKYGSSYITGYSWNGTDNDFITIKYNALGNEIWLSNFNGTGNGIDQSNTIALDEQGFVYVAGSSIGAGSLFDYQLLKYKQSEPTAIPNLLTPSNSATGIPTTTILDWSDVPTSEVYQVQIATDEAFKNLVFDSLIFFSSLVQISENHLTNEQKYYWRVNSNNVSGSGSWSVNWSFSVLNTPDVPKLMMPVNGAKQSAGEVVLKWYDVPTAASYHLQIARDFNFLQTVVDISNLTKSEYSLPKEQLTENTIYFWRVNASNAAGTVPWSDVWSIGVGNVTAPAQPQLTSLPNGSVGQSITPFLDWNDVPNAQSYHLQVSSDLNFTKIDFEADRIFRSEYMIPAGKLTHNTLYYWKINASNIGGVGNWSLIWTYQTMMSGIMKLGTEIPKDLKLYNNDPEPFAASTNIRFDIPKQMDKKSVQLAVYDILGKEIVKLVNDNLRAGKYSVTWDASNYSRGYYLYQIRTEGFVETKKMMLVK